MAIPEQHVVDAETRRVLVKASSAAQCGEQVFPKQHISSAAAQKLTNLPLKATIPGNHLTRL
ncbi:hypothetical protein SERLA73DRAFT_78185 [Serpula lacrymans var. lacrymans S7.3]|uniref:Uncharacterized protein n=2 Tax=Serpula lacrymans var. lacrymans TaxID=341189 RepID=F8QCE5_SERL3|nr:hypothetical protein SERLA73DRAFT_78185 [Serpula lacrymans var. lacrymans S7.3]